VLKRVKKACCFLPNLLIIFFLYVTVTGYSSTVAQTDEDPFITASNQKVKPGIIAVSRDLLKDFSFGTKVELQGIGVFVVQDVMAKRWSKRIDIWFPSVEEAKKFGKKIILMKKVEDR